jgi:hypothetical protein
MNEPIVFRPYALAKAPIISEGRITDDLTMPQQDWSKYDAPAFTRRTSKVVRRDIRRAA